MSPDDVSKACVPTVIRYAEEIELDGAYNAAHSHLRNPDEGIVRQMTACIAAIAQERARRNAKWPFRIAALALVISALSLGVSAWTAFSGKIDVTREVPMQGPPSPSPVPQAP